uniref:ATP-dependent DNA ligase family profile domain-containing protein n=1 Tax=Bionectria ochroleuca TaxID=29856 RepID=A0A8H7NHL9_BIOOC
MPFPFTLLCDLLNRLERNYKPSSIDKTQEVHARAVVSWFHKHNEAIPRRGTEAIAFLSCLFPERRPDRVFNLPTRQIEKIIERAQCLGSSRMSELQRWKANDGPDFASCVECVMVITDCEPRLGPNVTLSEIDEVLDQIAASSPFSSVALKERIKEKYGQSIRRDNLLLRLFRRLRSSETKWMIRMLSKNYSPAQVPEMLAMSEFHFLLPDILRFQSTIHAAVDLLSAPTIRCMPVQPAADTRDGLRVAARRELRPQVGTMATRPIYDKARSIRHCCQLASTRRMSVERKYDGEYCQIHIALNESGTCIKIFSKSGRDSTIDRIGIHRPLRDSLGLNRIECKIKKQCILEGELLVWNDDYGRIEPFHKIHKYVKRSGRLLGAAQDSPADLSEHLMIMFYDILLLDDTLCVRDSHETRRQLLQSLVRRIPGRADIGSREIVEFSSFTAAEQLSESFARAIAQRWEGLVLKGCDDPYFSFDTSKSFIKLKKDYIPGLGDTVDFVIIGGSRNANDEQELRIGKLWWTAFYIACVENKNELGCSNSKPRFRIVDVLNRHSISKDDIVYLNRHGYFGRAPFVTSMPEFDIVFEPGRKLQPAELFKYPFTVEVVGASFDKPANAAYFTLRFPRVLKVHEDRSFKDVISFAELQEIATNCQGAPDDLRREEESWLRRLRSDGHLGGRSRKSRSGGLSSPASGYVNKQGTSDRDEGTTTGSLHQGNTSFRSPKRKISPEDVLAGSSIPKRAKQD